MIRLATSKDTPVVRNMWKTCFGDTEEYMDLHFSEKYKEENTLLYFEGEEAVASLQMLPYSIRFYGQVIPFYYLAGLCTLADYREKGYMRQLINESFKIMTDRNIPICGLVPAEDWLFNYYSKFGFAQIFEAGESKINLRPILSEDLKESYDSFDKTYQQQDFTVLKSLDDFKTVSKEYINEGYPLKGNLRGMARIILPEQALKLYANKNPDKNFHIKTEEECFEIKNGKVSKSKSSDDIINADINLLTELLFGYNLTKTNQKYSNLFDSHNPIINLMME